MLKLSGMEGAAIDYAIHGHAVAHVPFRGSTIECTVLQREQDSLLLQLPDDIHSIEQGEVYVHFEINHIYFDGLHKAINCLSLDTISKLLPKADIMRACTTGRKLTKRENDAIKPSPIDSEYQMNAIERMVSSDPRVPFLVIGPFGTGKTHILAATVSALLCDGNSHILVCAHQHQCANGIYQILYQKYGHKIMRLVPNQQSTRFIESGRECVADMYHVRRNSRMLHQKQVIVTTFLTATNLPEMEPQLNFSHILIDEGAQTREPEALGALAIAKPETKIVIVGDNKQVRRFTIVYVYATTAHYYNKEC